MAINIPFSGSIYSIPSQAERNWASNVNSYLQALGANSLPRAGGAFSLSSDLDLGATATISMKALASKTANSAATGFVRLANTDTLSWRNVANSADLALGVNASNRLTFESVAIPTISSTDTLTNKTLATPVIGDASSIVAASGSVSGIVTTGTQTLAGAKTLTGITTIGPAGGGGASAGNAHTVRADAVSTLLVDNTSSAATAAAINIQNSGTVRSRWAASSTNALSISNQGVVTTLLELSQAGTLTVLSNDSTIRSANAANNAGAFIGHRQSDGTALFGALGSSPAVFRVNSADVGGISTAGTFTLGPSTASSVAHRLNGEGVEINRIAGAASYIQWMTGGVGKAFVACDITNGGLSFRGSTSGTVLGTYVDTGKWTLGPSAGLGTSGNAYHQIYGSTVAYSNGTNAAAFASGVRVNLNANLYRDGASSVKAVETATGYTSMEVTRTSSSTGTVFAMSANYQDAQTANSAAVVTNDRTIITADASGTWTLGAASNTSLHVVRGRLNVQGNSASAGGGVGSNNTKLLVNGDSASTASASTFHLGDNASGTSRQWALVNGRDHVNQVAGCLSFVVANAANTDPLNGSGTAPLIVYSGGIQLTTSGGTASLLNYYEEGSFTGSATGFTTTPAPIIYFTRVGKQVTLNISSFSATSNSVNFTITGLPARLSPTREINQLCIVSDNSAFQTTPGYCNITAGGTTLTFYRNTAGNNFTSSGVKGLTFTTVTYQLA